MLNILGLFSYCLIATIIAELLFAVIFRVRNRRDLGLITLANVVTNPWVVFIFALCQDSDYLWLIYPLLEVSAIVVEALLYKRYSTTIKYPWWLSIGANAFSILFGLLIEVFYLEVVL